MCRSARRSQRELSVASGRHMHLLSMRDRLPIVRIAHRCTPRRRDTRGSEAGAFGRRSRWRALPSRLVCPCAFQTRFAAASRRARGGAGRGQPSAAAPSGASPPSRAPGEGIPLEAQWGNPCSVKAYGHSRSRHGAARSPQELQDRARTTGNDQGQWYDDECIVEVEQRAPLSPGEHLIDLGRMIGRVYRPDGSIVETRRAKVVRKPDLTVRTSFPVSGD